MIAWTFDLSKAGLTGLSPLPARDHLCPVTEHVANSEGLKRIVAKPLVNFL